MKTSILFLFLIFTIIFFSCRKEDNSLPPAPVPEADYTQLHVGLYRIYEFYRIDTTGEEVKLDGTDSAYILKDTLIDGIRYYLRISHPLQFSKNGILAPSADTAILRDSSAYLVQRLYNGSSVILFSRDNFTDILFNDTIEDLLVRESRMVGKDSLVTLPIGTFFTRSMCTWYYPLQPSYPWGVRRIYNIYASGVGLIKYQYGFYSSPLYYEARLVRFNSLVGITK